MEESQGAGPIFYIKGAVPEDEGPGMHHLCPRLHGVSCETWLTRVWHIQQMEQAEMKMIRGMCGVSLSDGMSSEELFGCTVCNTCTPQGLLYLFPTILNVKAHPLVLL